jgi:hypothetical protein
MLHLDLKLNPKVEKKLVKLVNEKFNGSYEKFIETVLQKRENVLTRLIDISEDLGVEDLAEKHDDYLYGKR